MTSSRSKLSSLELQSFLNLESILDTEVTVDEIEHCIRTMKLGRSGGSDGLDPEHVCFGGEVLKLWLVKVFNRMIALEHIPPTLNEGLIIPIHKGKGRDPFAPGSYRGITLSSVIIKLFEVMILHRLSPVLEAAGVPDITQTAYQKGLSCVDAIFATQEALLVHARDGGKPFVGFYDMEKAFDSVETPILLERIYSVGVNGKLWRLLKSWYSTATARVRVDSCFSEKFSISRGVKQGSVLSPTLFLVVMDKLTRFLRGSSEGLSVKGLYMGAALHADDLRISAPSIQCLNRQDKTINQFTAESSLNGHTKSCTQRRVSQSIHCSIPLNKP